MNRGDETPLPNPGSKNGQADFLPVCPPNIGILQPEDR